MISTQLGSCGSEVGQEAFRRRKQLEKRIETELPHKYRSRYALVCYSYNDYADVFAAGEVQNELLDGLLDGVHDVDAVDMQRVEKAIDAQLTPVLERLGMTLNCG